MASGLSTQPSNGYSSDGNFNTAPTAQMTNISQANSSFPTLNDNSNLPAIKSGVLPPPKGFQMPTDNSTPADPTNGQYVKAPQPPVPTPVVSSKAATSQAQTIKQTADTAQQQIDANNANNQAQAQNTPPPTPPPTTGASTISSAEDAIVNAPNPGMQEAYNSITGQRVDQPIGELKDGFTSQNPQTRTDVTSTAEAGGGIQYKQFSDGTYGRFNVATGTYSRATSGDFANAQAVQGALTNLNNVRNGILTPSQQGQIDSVTNSLNNFISKTTDTFNSQTSGAMNIMQTPGGVGVGPAAIGRIVSLADNAASTIANAQVDIAKQVAAMQQAFLTNDTDALKNAYSQYTTSQTEVQKNIDYIQTEIDKQKAKTDAANSSIAVSMAKKYTDTSTPILPTDTPAQIQAKLQTSQKWQQDQQVAAQLTPDENNFWGQIALSGNGKEVAIPNLGIGKQGASAKIAIMKSIADNAQKLGLTAQDVATSLLDKTAKSKTYDILQKQGSQLATQESKVESDFDLVKSLGTKVPDAVVQTGIPFLQQWINTGTLATTNNPALNNWLGALTTSLTNYARVVYGQTGQAGVAQGANTEVQNLLKNGLSVATVNSYIENTAKPEMKNTITSYSQSLKQIQGDLNVADGTVNSNTLGVGSANVTGGTSKASTKGSGGLYDF